VSAPISFGNKKADKKGARTNTGTAPMNSVFVSGRIGYGSRKDALKGRLTGITAGPAASKRFELSRNLKAIS
jgi:hypothetical protein